MRPQDIDAHGRVALHDTATDEISHVHVHLAQEILARNKESNPDRFKVLTKEGKDSELEAKRQADAGKRRKVMAGEAALRKQEEGSAADMTDYVTPPHEAPVTQPAADSAPGVAEQDADPKKAAKVEKAEAKEAAKG